MCETGRRGGPQAASAFLNLPLPRDVITARTEKRLQTTEHEEWG